MTTDSKDKTKFDKATLYFLAWQDCIDRLDTLLLETRHLQQNIIYTLRSPILYRPLRYEECSLWDKNAVVCNEEILKDKHSDLKVMVDKLAEDSIILYPMPKHGTNEGDSEDSTGKKAQDCSTTKDDSKEDSHGNTQDCSKTKCEERKTLKEDIREFVNDALRNAKWTTDQRRHYHHLCALQILKRNIFSDKLLLFHEGYQIFSAISDSDGNSDMPKFMVLRSAVLSRIWNYVSRLGDHQEEFSKTLDMGLQDHPKPSMERRREQRVYSGYLSQRCIDIWLEVKMLVEDKFSNKDKKISRPHILHRWHHDFTSKSHSFFDDISHQNKRSSDDNKKKTHYTHYIDTSYFMPERPDLQSLIAHEVTHSFLRDYYDDLSRQKINLKTDSFSRLVKQLGQCLDVYQASRWMGATSNAHLRELAVDLLAAAVKGPAYLYALFLEITGGGLENLFFMGERDEVDLRLYDYLDGAGGQYDQQRDWYIRLNVVCEWLREIFKGDSNAPLTKLTVRLTEGIQSLLEEMIDYLDNIARPQQKTKQYWNSLKDRMCTLIRQSEAVKLVKNWRQERIEDYYSDSKLWPFYTHPLRKEVRQYILDCFKNKKVELIKEKKELSDIDVSDEKIINTCKNTYGFPLTIVYDKKCRGNNLFEYIYDIPWQSAFMEGLECINNKSDLRPVTRVDWIDKLHQFSISNRKFYQIALDFHLNYIDSPYLRLRETIRLLKDEMWKYDDSSGWCYGKEESILKKANKLYSEMPSKITNEEGKEELENELSKLEKRHFNKISDSHNDKKDYTQEPTVENRLTKIIKGERFLIVKKEMKEIDEKLRAIRKNSKKASEIKDNLKKLAEDYPASVFLEATLNLYEEPKEKQLLSRAIGYKLKELYGILTRKDNNRDSKFEKLKPLISYLKIRNLYKNPDADKEENFCDKIKKFLGKTHKKETFFDKIKKALCLDDKGEHSIKQYVIGRIAVGAVHKFYWENDGQGEDKEDDKEIFKIKKLIGRYDFLIYGPTRLQGQFWLPPFQQLQWENTGNNEQKPCSCCPGNKHSNCQKIAKCESCLHGGNAFLKSYPGKRRPCSSEEKFPPYFIRWEYAVPVRLRKESWGETIKKAPIALISIVLKHNTSRLYFLHRLLDVSRLSKDKRSEGEPKNLEQLTGYFQDGDRAFLSDGWEDLLIMFSGEHERMEHERIEDIFKIQKILFEDFQVERTELILTPKALDYVFCRPKNVRIEILYRVMNGSSFDGEFDKFKDAFKNNIKANKFGKLKKLPFPFETTVSRIPGRMDYMVWFNLPDNCQDLYEEYKINSETPVLHNLLIDLTEGTNIDRIQTNLGWVDDDMNFTSTVHAQSNKE